VLHLAGSKGKGSTALLAESVLRCAGRRVGTFTSPHLERWTERFRLDGAEVAPEALAAVVQRLEPHVTALRRAGGETVPSFFDAVTAAALCLFREARVDVAVLEVGLGGRLDSTNAAEPALCCITSIELEHTDRLGETLAEIAAEKAGILKPGVPALCGELADEAQAVVDARAAELGCELARLGREIAWSAEKLPDGFGQQLTVIDGGRRFEAELAVLGRHQAANAALATAACRRLLGPGFDPERFEKAARRGLVEVELPGRVEVISREPWLLVDSAHTEASARALAEVLGRLERTVDFVLSVSAGKSLDAILHALLPLARSLTLTRAEPSRSLAPDEIAAASRALAPGLPLQVVPNPHLALRAARESLPADGALCATGSVYLAGIARRVWREDASGRVVGTHSTL